MTGPHPTFAPGQASRLVPTRRRAVRQPGADAPFHEAPPLLLETLDDYTDIAPVGRPAPLSTVGSDTPRRTEQAPAEVTAADFIAWRRRHRR